MATQPQNDPALLLHCARSTDTSKGPSASSSAETHSMRDDGLALELHRRAPFDLVKSTEEE